jgi:hypothetical protein
MDYRRSVQPLMLQSCATANCHGSAGAGGLMFFTPGDTENVAYTNFYILQTFSRKLGGKQGPFGAGEHRLIDRTEPVRSLLVQYALPATIADDDHPHVNGYRAVFRSRDDTGYRRLLDWIADGLVHPMDSDYGITYTPPVGRMGGKAPGATAAESVAPATTQPATRP